MTLSVNVALKQYYIAIYTRIKLSVFSLLDILAGRKDRSGLIGQVMVNGEPQPRNFKCISGYVVQVSAQCHDHPIYLVVLNTGPTGHPLIIHSSTLKKFTSCGIDVSIKGHKLSSQVYFPPRKLSLREYMLLPALVVTDLSIKTALLPG